MFDFIVSSKKSCLCVFIETVLPYLKNVLSNTVLRLKSSAHSRGIVCDG